MPRYPLSDEVATETIELVMAHDGDISKAARASGLPRSTLQHRYRRALEIKGSKPKPQQEGLAVPEFPDEDVPVEELVEIMARRYQKRFQHEASRMWFPVPVPSDDILPLAFVGDPHIDDDGCDWPTLKADIELLRSRGIAAINVGDTTNNWPVGGRLGALWAKQETSQKTAHRLARWFMHDSGVPWFLWLLGNHDKWNDGGAVLQEISNKAIPVFDWQARFILKFPNGFECPIWVSHNFKGTSLYNILHGPMRAARFGQMCPRLLVQGHHHEYGVFNAMYEDTQEDYWAVKVKGYKKIDHHADHHQFPSMQGGGESVMSVIDPATGSVKVFPSIEEGAEFVEWKRERAGTADLRFKKTRKPRRGS